jgi:tetratricopeptide (TPR) repeat protein
MAILTALLGAGCASVGGPGPSPQETPATPPPAATPPAVELDRRLLYDLLLGEIAAQRGDFDIAVGRLKRAAFETRDPRLAERATLVAFHAKRYDAALESAQLWVELDPISAEAREALAASHMERGELDAAREHFAAILAAARTHGQLGPSFLRVAAVLGRQQHRAAALTVMGQLAALYPEQPEGQFAHAHVAVRAGELDTALSAIEQTLVLRPAWEEAALFKVRILVSRKDDEALETFYARFLAEYPRARDFRSNYARHLIEKKQWDQAREQFKIIVSDSPGDADALYAIGLLAMQADALDEASHYLNLVLEQNPEHDQAQYYLGQIAERSKNYEQALTHYRTVGPGTSHFDARLRIAAVIARQGNVAGAREELAQLTPLNDNQVVQLALAEEQILHDAREYREAYEVLTRVLARLPDDADLLYARALAAERLDRIDVLEADLRKILEADPHNATALNALGYTLADRTERYKEALALIEKALELKPEDPYVMDSMGWVQYRLGNHTEALKYLRSALDRRNDAEIAAHLGEVLWMVGDRAAAESVWQRALQETPDNEALIGVIRKFKP